MRVLVVNAGSASLKLRLLDGDRLLESADLAPDDELGAAIGDWPAPDAVGHRVVHGGTDFAEPVVVDSGVRQRLDELTALAPLHQPKSLRGLDAVSRVLPDVPAVACFDTAFHRGIPAAAATYAVPTEWQEQFGIRRFGFHGLSHAYCSGRAAELVRRPVEGLRVVSCHLGGGASLAAVVGGRSVDTTMGFTPLEGLVMATRSGSVDPGLLLWLEEHEGLAPHEIARALEQRSGLLGLTGTADLREVERRAGAGDQRAELGLAVYLHRLVTGIGAMAVAAGGLDVLAFTGGVGENSALVRQRAAERLTFLGVGIGSANDAGSDDRDISAPDARVRTVVVQAREDLQIAREVARCLTG